MALTPGARLGQYEILSALGAGGMGEVYRATDTRLKRQVAVNIQPFPGPGAKSLISTMGGSQVRWGRDGKELFYVARNGQLMSVPIRFAPDGQPYIGSPAVLFAPPLGDAVQQGDFRHQYMVSRDSQQFLVATVKEAGVSPITLIVNWKPKP